MEAPKEIKETQELVRLQAEVPTLISRAQNFQIRSDIEYQTAGEVTRYFANQQKAIEAEKQHQKEPIAPIIETGKRIDRFFKKLSEPISSASRIVKDKMADYYREKEQARWKAEQEIMMAEAKRLALDSPPPAPVTIIPSLPEAKGISVRKHWKFTIDDEVAVPRYYLKVDDKKIRDAIREGVRQIPGVNIFQVETIATRK